jgi:dextranase
VTAQLAGVRCAYLTGEPIRVDWLGDEVAVALVRTAFGHEYPGRLLNGEALITGVPAGTHALELRSADGALLVEELLSVRDAAGDDPILAFATSFDSATVPLSLRWLERLRCTVVQIYDWMETYSSPLGQEHVYHDRIGRAIHRDALIDLIEGLKGFGAVPQAYAPVIAADPGETPDLRLYRNDGAVESLGDLLDIMDPGAPAWHEHWLRQYGAAADELGFSGFHLDTYGYPRGAVDADGKTVEIRERYDAFVRAVRAARPDDLLSFNQVNGVPSAFDPPEPPSFRYAEVWPPNDRWRHLEGLMARSTGSGGRRGDTLAIYPPVWDEDRGDALRTAILTEAVTTMLGIGVLIWGDSTAALRHPYYVDHERLLPQEAETVMEWHRFALRCRDLFKTGEDTSWYELDDENAAVTVSAALPVRPEPVGGSVFARIVRTDRTVVISLLDLSGSADGSWSDGTAPGTCTAAKVSALVPEVETWRADVAVLGRNEGRFAPLELSVEPHREGMAVSAEVPLVAGWSVLRLEKEEN